MVRKTEKGYQVVSEEGKPLSADDLTEEEAHKRLAEVEAFKHMHAKDSKDPERVTRLDFTGRFDSSRRTPQGGLKVPAYLTRVGVLSYRQKDGSVVRELRHPDEVFKADSLETLAAAPVTVGHPGKVAPENWGKYSVGHVGEQVSKADDKFVSATLRIQDAKAVSGVEKGELLELSCGYDCDVVPEAGEWNGEKYDARQTNISYNHVALLPKNGGRAGNDVRLRLDGEAEVLEDVMDLDQFLFSRLAECMAEDSTEDALFFLDILEKQDCWPGQDEESCHGSGGGGGAMKGAAPKGEGSGALRSRIMNPGKRRVPKGQSEGGVKRKLGESEARGHQAESDASFFSRAGLKKEAAARFMVAHQHFQEGGHTEHAERALRRAKEHGHQDAVDVGGKLPETPTTLEDTSMDEATKKAHQDALDALQKQLDTVTGERDALKKEVAELRDPARMDAAAEDLASFRSDAKSILGDMDVKGTRREVMIAALTKCGAAFKADDSDDYLRGMFAAEVTRTKVAAQSAATVRKTAEDAQSAPAVSPVEEAKKRSDERSRNAWKKG